MRRGTARAAAAGLALLTAAGAVALAGIGVPADAISPKDASAQLFAMTNIDRTSNGRRALARDNRLATVAEARSKDMIERDYFAHEIPPSGITVVDVLESLGVPFRAAGENIAWNTANDFASVQDAGVDFINSPHHRENLLDPRWERMGTGVWEGGGKKMYTVVFLETIPAGTAPGAAAVAQPAAPRAAPVARVHGERVETASVRTGLLTRLVNDMVRLFLDL